MQDILLIVHILPLRSTVIALVGHLRAQMPHKMQFSSMIVTCPLVRSVHSRGTAGYIAVAGFLKRLLSTVLAILKDANQITAPYSLCMDQSSESAWKRL